MSLIYLRLYVPQPLLGYLFNLDTSNVSRTIRRVRPLLTQVLPVPVQETLLNERPKKRIGTLEELLKRHPAFKEVLIDATEQELKKPKDRLKKRQRYSGKKRCHTAKTQVATSHGLVFHLSRWIPGRLTSPCCAPVASCARFQQVSRSTSTGDMRDLKTSIPRWMFASRYAPGAIIPSPPWAKPTTRW